MRAYRRALNLEEIVSPIFVTDKDYEFSIDPDMITLVESDPFYGYESETVMSHLTKLNDIATLSTHEEKNSLLLYLEVISVLIEG